MATNYQGDWDWVAPCSTCDAKVGEPCKTRKGDIAIYAHKPRFLAAVERGEIKIFGLEIVDG